jgi:hypothetical protein
MSERAIAFVESWVSENVSAQGYQANGDDSQAKALAVQCRNAASAEGISQAEMDAAFDDLTAFIAGEMEEAHDRDVAGSPETDD